MFWVKRTMESRQAQTSYIAAMLMMSIWTLNKNYIGGKNLIRMFWKLLRTFCHTHESVFGNLCFVLKKVLGRWGLLSMRISEKRLYNSSLSQTGEGTYQICCAGWGGGGWLSSEPSYVWAKGNCVFPSVEWDSFPSSSWRRPCKKD